MNNRIIFLDFDGVVNTPYWSNGNCRINSHADRSVSNYQAICWLNELFTSIKFDIVVTSTWRMSETIEGLREILYNSGLSKEIKIIDKTSVSDDHYRGKEIQQWIKGNNYTGEFVILDDDTDMQPYSNRLVKCNTYSGFGYSEMMQCLSLF